MPVMRYVSHCTANRWVINADMKLSMLSVGSQRNSGNEYPDDQTRDGERSTTKTCCAGVVARSADDSWLTAMAALTARNPRQMYTCRVWLWCSLGLKIASQIVLFDRTTSSLYQQVWCTARPTYMPAWPPGSKSNWPVDFAVKSIVVKEVGGREIRQNARNQHATSVFEQRQIHRETSYHRKLTVDGKKIVI